MSRVGLLICLFFISCILLFWNPFWSVTNSPKDNSLETYQPDFVADDMTSRQYTEEGYLSSQVHAQHMEHFDKLNITKFTRPSYIVYPEQGSPRWKITADDGIFDQRYRVVLKNNVTISAIDPNERVKEIKTTYLELNLNTMKVESDQPIYIIGEQFFINAVGLKADLNQRHIELIKDIQAVYENNQS